MQVAPKLRELHGWSLVAWSINPRLSLRLHLVNFSDRELESGIRSVVGNGRMLSELSFDLNGLHVFPTITETEYLRGRDENQVRLFFACGGEIKFAAKYFEVVVW